MRKVVEKAKKKDYAHPLLFKVPKRDTVTTRPASKQKPTSPPAAYEPIKATIGRRKEIDAKNLIAHVYRARETGSRKPNRP